MHNYDTSFDLKFQIAQQLKKSTHFINNSVKFDFDGNKASQHTINDTAPNLSNQFSKTPSKREIETKYLQYLRASKENFVNIQQNPSRSYEMFDNDQYQINSNVQRSVNQLTQCALFQQPKQLQRQLTQFENDQKHQQMLKTQNLLNKYRNKKQSYEISSQIAQTEAMKHSIQQEIEQRVLEQQQRLNNSQKQIKPNNDQIGETIQQERQICNQKTVQIGKHENNQEISLNDLNVESVINQSKQLQQDTDQMLSQIFEKYSLKQSQTGYADYQDAQQLIVEKDKENNEQQLQQHQLNIETQQTKQKDGTNTFSNAQQRETDNNGKETNNELPISNLELLRSSAPALKVQQCQPESGSVQFLDLHELLTK